jgi:predicted transcriptional regulator
MAGNSGARAFVVDKPQAVRALASPLRQSIVDTIVANGELTVAALAEILHRSAHRLYYHVDILEKVGLLRGRESRSSNGRSEVLFDVPGRPVFLRYQPSSPANKRRCCVRQIEISH